jgi:hypothetical protein
MSDDLNNFVASYSSGAQGCQMDCDTAQEMAEAITALRDRLAEVEKERDAFQGNADNNYRRLMESKAELATARRDALEEAAKEIDCGQCYGKTCPRPGDCMHDLAVAIRALIAQEEPTT